ncbi:MAG: outer membrane lipoprotein-sorting protein [Bacteroidota bacterium]
MKTLKISLALIAMALSCSVQAQTADEILENYFENTGGIDAWKSLEGMKMTAKVNQQGMEIPLEIYQLKDGRQMTKISLQGKAFYQGVFDGETLWGTNFQSMKAEKSDAEATANFKLDINDFPDSFIDYKEKGYTVELLGKETIDGAETFKIKLIKEPKMVDGNQQDDISFYFFDVDNFVPIAVQSEITSGPFKGQTGQTTMSDYQEVDGMYFPFSMTQGVKDGQGQPFTIETIELNPQVDDAEFSFPEEMGKTEKE